VRSDKSVLQVGDLNLVFSLVLEGSGSIVDSRGGNNSLRSDLGTFILMVFVFLGVLLLLLRDGINDLFLSLGDFSVSFDITFNLFKLDFEILGLLGVSEL